MFKVGDIVKIKSGYYLGIKYTFEIFLVEEALNPACFNVYRVARNKQQKLDPAYGPYDYQIKIIDEIENRIWKENELELAELTPETAVKIKNKNLFDICVQGNPEGITIQIQGDSFQTILSDEIKWSIISIDSSGNVLQRGKKICTINKKEEKEMKILDLYEERKSFEINNNYNIKRNELLEKDTIQNIINEMQDQVNALLEEDNMTDARLKINRTELITKETREKIEKLEVETDKKKDELYASLEEIRALFEMTDDYNEKIKILKNYDILDKKGKLNI